MKKIILLILSIIITMSTVGCKTDNIGEDTITVLMIENFTRIGADQNTPVSLALQEKFGIEFKFITGSNVNEVTSKLNSSAITNTIPDLVITQGNTINLQQKKFLNFKLYEDKMPNMFSYINRDDIKKSVSTLDGTVILAPGIVDLRVLVTYMIRYDWLNNIVNYGNNYGVNQSYIDKIDAGQPLTLKEYENIMYAFRNNDPDSNTQKDTFGYYPYGGQYWVQKYAENFNANAFNIIREDEVVYGPLEPEFKTAVQYLNKLYRDEILDPEFYLGVTSDYEKYVSTNKIGLTSAYFNRCDDLNEWSKTIDSAADWRIILPPVANDGKMYMQGQSLPLGNNGIAVNKNIKSNKLDKIINLIDYLYSEEGRILTAFGVEGETYEMVDGDPVFLPSVTINPNWPNSRDVKTYYGIEPQTGFALVQDRNSFIFKKTTMDGIKLYEDNIEMLDNMLSPPPQRNITYNEQERKATTIDWLSINDYKEAEVFKFIMGTRDLSEWNTFTNELKNRGIEGIMQKFTDAYRRSL